MKNPFFFFNYLKTNIKMLSSSWRINFITFLFQQLLLMVLQIKKEPLGSVKWRRGCFRFWDWKVVVLPSMEAISVWVVAKTQQGEEMGRESRSFFVYLFFSGGISSVFNLWTEPTKPLFFSLSLCSCPLFMCFHSDNSIILLFILIFNTYFLQDWPLRGLTVSLCPIPSFSPCFQPLLFSLLICCRDFESFFAFYAHVFSGKEQWKSGEKKKKRIDDNTIGVHIKFVSV